MAACLENIQIPTCLWFEGGDKRNAVASMIAGVLVSQNRLLFNHGFLFLILQQCRKV